MHPLTLARIMTLLDNNERILLLDGKVELPAPPMEEYIEIKMLPHLDAPVRYTLQVQGPIKSKNKRARREARGW